MSDYSIRSYKFADTSEAYKICLKTGNSGQDATHLFSDPLVSVSYTHLRAHET